MRYYDSEKSSSSSARRRQTEKKRRRFLRQLTLETILILSLFINAAFWRKIYSIRFPAAETSLTLVQETPAAESGADPALLAGDLSGSEAASSSDAILSGTETASSEAFSEGAAEAPAAGQETEGASLGDLTGKTGDNSYQNALTESTAEGADQAVLTESTAEGADRTVQAEGAELNTPAENSSNELTADTAVSPAELPETAVSSEGSDNAAAIADAAPDAADQNAVTSGLPAENGYVFTDCREMVYATDDLNVRSSCQAVDSSNILVTIPAGTFCTRTGYNDTWSRIEVGGVTCYAATQYLAR